MTKRLILGIATLALCGCSTTTITETTYNEDGSISFQKVTETNENAIVVLSKDIGKNSIAVKQGGWFGNIGVNAQSQSYGIQAGTLDNSLIMAQDSENGVKFAATIPPAWKEQKYSFAITKEGITSEGGNENEAEPKTSVPEKTEGK